MAFFISSVWAQDMNTPPKEIIGPEKFTGSIAELAFAFKETRLGANQVKIEILLEKEYEQDRRLRKFLRKIWKSRASKVCAGSFIGEPRFNISSLISGHLVGGGHLSVIGTNGISGTITCKS